MKPAVRKQFRQLKRNKALVLTYLVAVGIKRLLDWSGLVISIKQSQAEAHLLYQYQQNPPARAKAGALLVAIGVMQK